MKTIKVDVKQTLLDLREGTPVYYEAEYDPKNIMIRTEGEIPDTVQVRQHAYEIRKVFTAAKFGAKEERVYAIRLDDRGLFDDLMQISNDVFVEKLDKAREEGFWEGESKGAGRGIRIERERIKNLSWWKRLMNKI